MTYRPVLHRLPPAGKLLTGGALAVTWSLLAFAGTLHAFEPSGLLEIHHVNVQQGASALIIGPDGTTVLLDAGDDGKGAQIVPYLGLAGLEPEDGLDYTIAGHLHDDHVGGFDEVFAAGYDVRFGNWYNGSQPEDPGTAVTDYLEGAGETSAGGPLAAIVGDTIDLGDGAVLTVVASAGVVIGHGFVAGAEKENDLSIAVLIQYGGFDYIWASDLGGGDDDHACTGRSTGQANVETPLAQAIMPGGTWPLLSDAGVEVLHVNHHGSESSTNSDYVGLLSPAVAVIPVGAGQPGNYQHPRKAVVENVLLAGAPCVTTPAAYVLQTEEGSPTGEETSFAGFAVGDVKISTDGVGGFLVEANGAISQGPDERADAELPRIFPFDPPPEPSPGGLLLSEVLYDVDGNDDGLEWVEIYNTGSQSVDLAAYSLGSGGENYAHSVAQLEGTIPPCGTFVVGGPLSNADNASPSYDQEFDFDPNLENNGNAGDGVALFDVPATAINPSTVPIDAVIYGPNNDNGLIDESGTAPPPDVGDAAAGSSIERSDLAGSWRIRLSPDPNAAPYECEIDECVASATTLCLPGDERFAVSVHYQTSQGGGREGDGRTIPLDPLNVVKGGIFYFSDRANPELLVKVLDGCTVNDHFWVFYAATTNVGFELTVSDTLTGQTRDYTNPDFHPADTVTDTNAFPCGSALGSPG